ncbi:MAG: SDR family oxidoreductase [Ignavibacteriales bacterium]
MKLLVIGASGFVGSHLYNSAVARGFKVIGTRCGKEDPRLIKFDLLSDSMTDIVNTNFGDTTNLCAVICAANPKIEWCYSQKELSYRLNVSSTIRTIEELTNMGIKCVFLSSDYVYDGKQGYYDESILPSPSTEYGRQKAEVERYIINNHPQNLILRLSMTVGDDPAENHLLARWYESITAGETINCIEGQVFSPTFVEDVSEGILGALDQDLCGLYNLCNNEFFNRAELAKQFMIAVKGTSNIVSMPVSSFNFSEERPLLTYLDGSKLRNAVGIQFTSMRDVFKKFIRNI